VSRDEGGEGVVEAGEIERKRQRWGEGAAVFVQVVQAGGISSTSMMTFASPDTHGGGSPAWRLERRECQLRLLAL
jgi:hypothetical protein